jgi:hypothetical protein
MVFISLINHNKIQAFFFLLLLRIKLLHSYFILRRNNKIPSYKSKPLYLHNKRQKFVFAAYLILKIIYFKF